MIPAEKSVPVCRRCSVGEHEFCVGIGCQCEMSKRCKVNAVLTRAREDRGGSAA